MQNVLVKIEIYDSETDEETAYVLPGKYEVCPECMGKGTIVNPNIDRYHGITRKEFDNDSQFFEDYQSGIYDIECFQCKGLRVIEVIDETRLDSEQKKVFARYQDLKNDREQFDREWANEIRMQEYMGGAW